MENERNATLMDVAGWMALPIGLLWSASFICNMYGAGHPLLPTLGTALGILSIYKLYRQLVKFRRGQGAPVSWLRTLGLSLLTCLLAGLLTDAVQYLYFLLFDNGRMLSLLGTTLQSEEYREAWKQIMPGADLEEMQRMIQDMTVRDIMVQLAFYNILLALPISLIAALPVRKGPLPPPREPQNLSS